MLCELGGKCPQMTAWVELDGSYFCFSDCFALIILTTVPFYRLLALTTCIFSAADFTGIYHLSLKEVHRLSVHTNRLIR